MKRIRSGGRPRTVEAVREDTGGRRLAVTVGMLVFLVGLALLFVANAPS
jgi:hypothetical protein